MQLHCQTCHSPLRAEDVRLDIAVAKCHACNAVHDLTGRKDPGQPVVPARLKLVRAKAAVPQRFQVDDDGTRMRISWRWFGWRHLGMLAFCLAWDGFLVTVYTGMLTSKEPPPLGLLLVPLLHVGVGVWLTYTTLAGLLNRTEVDATRSELTIRHGPLPWPGNQTLPGRSLAQLYVEEVNKLRRSSRSTEFHLHAVDREGRKVKVLKGLEERDEALYLEQVLEHRLGIEDAPVDGEVATRTQVA